MSRRGPSRPPGERGAMPAVDELQMKGKIAEVLYRWPSAGLAVGVVRDGSLEWFLGHGVADMQSKEPITEDTVFRVVSNTLADQKITVSPDASCLAGDEVNGPFSAYCEATVIDKHALEATGGLRYAELEREDPKRQTAATASFLQASLFTSVVAYGVAAMAIAIGVLFILIGLGIRDVARRIRDLAGRAPATA